MVHHPAARRLFTDRGFFVFLHREPGIGGGGPAVREIHQHRRARPTLQAALRHRFRDDRAGAQAVATRVRILHTGCHQPRSSQPRAGSRTRHGDG